MPREFSAAPAERKAQNLFIGLVSPSGGGKSFTALELAMGIQAVSGGEVAFIDTENGRGLAYADLFRKPDGSPGFMHIPFEPPWGSLDYVAALEYAASKAKTIIVDGASNEHEAMLEFQEAEVQRMAGNDFAKQERVKMLAWAKPKAHRRKLIQAVTRLDANIIMCFRAKETSKPGKNAEGKSVVIPMGFVPMAAPELTFEMSLSVLFLPGARGTPTWNPEHVGERIAVKLPKQFEWLLDHRGPLSRDVGRRLAEWARGGKGAGSVASNADTKRDTPAEIDLPALRKTAEIYADRGDQALTDYLGTLNKAQKDALRPYGTDLRARAQAVGQKPAGDAGTQDGGQSEAKPYQLSKTPDNTLSFENESDYLWAYEEIVDLMHSAGNTAGLQKFDERNAALIAQHEGLGLAVNVIDRKVRV